MLHSSYVQRHPHFNHVFLVCFIQSPNFETSAPRVGGIAGGYYHQVGVYVPSIHKVVWVFVSGNVVLGLGFFLSTIVIEIDSILLIFTCNAQHHSCQLFEILMLEMSTYTVL